MKTSRKAELEAFHADYIGWVLFKQVESGYNAYDIQKAIEFLEKAVDIKQIPNTIFT